MFMPRTEQQQPLCSLQLTTSYSQFALVCQAPKQPDITAINSLSLTVLTSDRKAAITPASLGSFSVARSANGVSLQKSASRVQCLWAVILLLLADATVSWEHFKITLMVNLFKL